MKIRSITYFCNPHWPLEAKVIQNAAEFLYKAKPAFEAAGYEVQMVRLATVPFPRLLSGGRRAASGETAVTRLMDETPRLAEELEKLILQAGIAYASLGPALPDFPRSYEVIPEAIAATKNIFFGGGMAGCGPADSNVYLAAVRACAEVVVKSASLEPNGFANLRFASLANVKAGSPFFPAAYHTGNRPAFAIATEAADMAVEAFTGSKSCGRGTEDVNCRESRNMGRQLRGSLKK